MKVTLLNYKTYTLILVFALLTGCNNSTDKSSATQQDSAKTSKDSVVRTSRWPASNKERQVESRVQAYYQYRESAAPPWIKQKLAILRHRIDSLGLSFQVGFTSVLGKRIDQITGEAVISEKEKKKLKAIYEKNLAMEGASHVPYIVVNGKPLSPDTSILDLREYGLVTPVVDQDSCNACWAFGSMGAYESNYLIRRQRAIFTSEQYVINCSGAGTIDSGIAFKVFEWMVNSHKNVDSAKGTPFTELQGTCKMIPPKTDYYAVEWGFVSPEGYLNPDKIPSVREIKVALCEYGAISASVFADLDFQGYTIGIQKETTKYPRVNHAVTIIGWDDSKHSWIVKNSWGTGWGNPCSYGNVNGYMYIDYGSNNIGARAAWVKAR